MAQFPKLRSPDLDPHPAWRNGRERTPRKGGQATISGRCPPVRQAISLPVHFASTLFDLSTSQFEKLRYTRFSLAFLKHHLPAEVLKDMDLTQIRNESECLVGERLNNKVVDVLLSVPYKGGRALIYILFEHQSTVDPLMPFRLLVYVVEVLERWLRQRLEGTKVGKFPIVFPLVFYNGETPYHFVDLYICPAYYVVQSKRDAMKFNDFI